jgi:hypothetical protein
MTLSVNKTAISLLLALGIILGGVAFTADAQVAEATQCRVRATVPGDVVSQLTGGQFTGGVGPGLQSINTHSLVCVYSMVLWITNILFVVLLALAALFIVIAAFLFVTAAGSEDKRNKAKSFFLYAVIGLVIAVIARSIPAIVLGLIGLQ